VDGISWANISKETDEDLHLSHLDLSHSGTKYRVIVYSDCGNITSDVATLTVKKKPKITSVSLNDTTITYDDQSHTLVVSGDLPDGVTVGYENNDQTDAGEYTVKAFIDGGNNYQDDTLTAALTIEKAGIKNISLQDTTFPYDGQSHTLVVSGDRPDGVTVGYENNDQTDAGEYTVKAFINGGNNYQDDTLTATLTIEKAVQGITFDALAKLLLEKASDFQLTAKSSSGLPVIYSFTAEDNPPAAEVSPKGQVTLIHSGTITISAHQEGNDNYLPA